MLVNKRRFIVLCITSFIGLFAFDQWIERTELHGINPSTSDMVYDRNSTLMTAFLTSDDYWRFDVGLGQIDPKYIALLVAYEDKRFYRHNGVDIQAMLRALGQLVTHGKIISGGSTITMQVARLTERLSTGALGDKVRQIRVALAMERRLSKQEILHLYMKLAPFGGNVEGVAAASYSYLGKAPKRLTIAQAALLVAIPQSPNQRRPDRNNEAARAARDKVLRRGFEAAVIDAGDLKAALSENVSATLKPMPRFALHLAGKYRKHPKPLTLDLDIQRRAETLFLRKLENIGQDISGAVIIADYTTGEVLTYIGSPDFTSEQRKGYVDMATAIRSPGSTLKPFVYAKAFADGILHPKTLIADMPARFGQYEPSNFDGEFRGMMTAHDALIGSRNIPAVAILNKVGTNRFSAVLNRAGIELSLPQDRDPGLAIVLGGVGVSLRQMVQAYGGLAHHGQAISLHETVQEPVEGAQFINPTAATMVAEILRTMPAPSTTQAGSVAYKTGTSYGHRDSWAIGFDGQHVIGVLLGRADNTAIPGAFGAALATPILFQMFDIIGVVRPSRVLLQNTRLTVLPSHLKQFAAPEKRQDSVNIVFPPEGATIEICPPGLVVKINGGAAPYRLILNDELMPKLYYERAFIVPVHDDGFYTVSIIDARADVSSQRFLASTSNNTCSE